jgi:hypothetical protein
VGLFDEAENLAGQADGAAGGQGAADGLVGDATQEAEKLLDNDTGNKFDSEIQDAGTLLDQKLPDL